MLWNSVDIFIIFPCFWYRSHFFINRSMSLSISRRKVFPKFFFELHIHSLIRNVYFRFWIISYSYMNIMHHTLLSFFWRNYWTFIFIKHMTTKRTKRFKTFLQICFLPLSLVISSKKEFSSQCFSITSKPFFISETVDFSFDALTFISKTFTYNLKSQQLYSKPEM